MNHIWASKNKILATITDSPGVRYRNHRKQYGQVNNFPGLEMRKVDMSLYNETKAPTDYRQLLYYRPIGPLSTELNLHACAHLYASDRNGMYIISNALKYGDQVNVMGSLSHSVVFHTSSKDLMLRNGEWWCQESWTARSEGGRGMVESRIIKQNGVHVASSWQDGLIRKAKSSEDEKLKALWYKTMTKNGKLTKEAALSFKL
jgi:acyl-CoA thioesterase